MRTCRMTPLAVAMMNAMLLPGVAVVLGLTTATASGQSFQGLGDLPGGIYRGLPYGVSADGSVVVGLGYSASGAEAFRWTQAGGMVGLDDLPGGAFGSCAYGVSADGSVVVGLGYSASGAEAFRWTQAGGMVGLGDLPGGAFGSCAYGVSSDGSVVVGTSVSESGDEAFRWVDSNGNGLVDPDEKLDYHPDFGLGDLPGGDFDSCAYGVSSNGSVVVGTGVSESGGEAFRWTQAGGMVGLDDLPGGGFYSHARAVSADGSVVVGVSISESGWEAFRWTQAGGMVGLGDLPGGDFWSDAKGVSADGSIVVGTTGGPGSGEAFYWTEAGGMVNLRDLLVDTYSLDLTGWSLGSAADVSDNGRTIVGTGLGPSGPEPWIARLSRPWTVLVFLNGDNDLEAAAVDDFVEMASVGSSDDLDIVVQFDRIPGHDTQYGDWTNTRRFHVQPGDDPDSTPVQTLGEVNMGDPNELVDFAVWGITNYPAQHYLLVIWNHGGGWGPRRDRGVSWDDTDGSDFFSVNEVRDALADIRTQTGAELDVLGFDACLMQMVEVAYSVRESCDFVVASEELEPFDGWAYDVFLAAIQANSTAHGICAEIVNAYQAQHGQTYPTQSAFSTEGLDDLADKIDILAEELMTGMFSEPANILAARQDASLVTFDYDGDGNENADSYVDLGHLCQLLKAECDAQEIKDAADDVRAALDYALVVNETNGSYYDSAEGLSIYFPDHQPDWVNGDDYYANYQNEGGSPANLDFVADTCWDDFIRVFVAPGCPYIYDLDGSCFVDATDLGLFAACWLLSEGADGWDENACADKDFDCSGTVNATDLGLFAGAWLKWDYDVDPADYPACRPCGPTGIICPWPE